MAAQRRTARQFDDAQHARHFQGRRLVHAFQLAAKYGRTGDDGIRHAIKARVNAEVGVARNNVMQVDAARAGLSDVAQLARRFQADTRARRHWQFGRFFGQRAEGQRASAGRMHDRVVGGFDLRHGHVPAHGRRRFQHQARRGAHVAHGAERVAHAARTVRILAAVARFVGGRLLHAHLRPVGAQFICRHHGQAGADALAHFGAVRHDGDDAVGTDRQEDKGVVDHAASHIVAAVFDGVGRHHQAGRAGHQGQAGQRAGGLEPVAPRRRSGDGDILKDAHLAAPFALMLVAACLMAAWMRV